MAISDDEEVDTALELGVGSSRQALKPQVRQPPSGQKRKNLSDERCCSSTSKRNPGINFRDDQPFRAMRRTSSPEGSASKAPESHRLAIRQSKSGNSFLKPEQLELVRKDAERVVEEESTGAAVDV